jgi:hypothetical protein
MSSDLREADERILLALNASGERSAELQPLTCFYAALFQAQFAAKADLAPGLRLPAPATLRARLDQGLTLLTGDEFAWDTARFRGLMQQMAEIIVKYNPGLQVPPEPLDPDALVALARRWPPGDETSEAGLDALAVGFAVCAYLQAAADRLLPEVDISEWQRGACPVCGGQPDFAWLSREDGSRRLFCPRCHAIWPYKRVTCPFCERDERVAYYPSADEVYRLYVCRDCGRYLKAIDLRRTDREVLPPVERVLTIGLDLAARQDGFQ